MDQSGFIVGIDFGTSKIVGVLGRKNEQGVITILASESIASDSCVKYGVIYNIDEAAGKIKKLINLLENKVGKKIGKVYVSIAGKSLRAIEHTETKSLGEPQQVSFVVLDKMEQQAKLNKPDFFTNYSVLSPEYYLDGKYEEDPIEKTATDIEGRFHLIIGRPNIKNNLVKALTEKNQIGIAGFAVGPMTSGILILDEAERQSGCALIDFGAGTTTVSVYKNGHLKFMSVIPFGGRTITKDIQSLGFASDAAESYKIKYGRLGKKKDAEKVDVAKSDVDLRELNKVIQLRADEIILNINNQIKLSGYSDQLEAGVVIIGGASQLNGLPEYLSEKLGLPVKKGAAKRVYINNAAELLQNPSYTQSLSVLLFANENCEKEEEVKPVQPVTVHEPSQDVAAEEKDSAKKTKVKKADKKQKSLFDIFEKIQNFGGTMFKEED